MALLYVTIKFKSSLHSSYHGEIYELVAEKAKQRSNFCHVARRTRNWNDTQLAAIAAEVAVANWAKVVKAYEP